MIRPAAPATGAPAKTNSQSLYTPSICSVEVKKNLPPVTEILQTELHWRQLTHNPATEVVIAYQGADKYFDIGRSTPNRIAITLPFAFIAAEHSWPVMGCIVALVETGCYERELVEACKRSGATFIECYSRTMQEPYIVPMDNVARMAA